MSRLTKQLTITVAGLRGPGLSGADLATIEGAVTAATEAAEQAEADREAIAGSAALIGTALQPGDPLTDLGETPDAKVMKGVERSWLDQVRPRFKVFPFGGWSAYVADKFGNIAGGWDSLGVLRSRRASFTGLVDIGRARINALSIERINFKRLMSSANAVLAAVDRTGNIAFRVRQSDGITEAGAVSTKRLLGVETINGVLVSQLGGAPAAALVFVSEIEAIVVYGQSLSLGQFGTDIWTASQPGTAIKFGDASYSTFAALTEPVRTVSGVLYETPSGGLAQALQQLIQIENGLVAGAPGNNFVPFLFNPGEGGAPIGGLVKGQAPYARLIAQLTTARDLAAAQGKSFRVRAVHWLQGQGDYVAGTTAASYKTQLRQLRIDLDTDIRTLIPDNPTLLMVLSQPASHKRYQYRQEQGDVGYTTAIYAKDANIAVAQYEMAASSATDDQYFTMVTPEYVGEYTSDLVHAIGATYKLFGGYRGVAHKRLMEVGADIRSTFIWVKQVQRQGRVIELECSVPKPPLVIDEALTTAVAGGGFTLLNGSGVDAGAVTTTVITPTRLRIVSPVDISAGFKLRYAIDQGLNHTGKVDGPRGNVRDSAGAAFVFDPAGINRRLHNAFPVFQHTF